MIFGRFSRGNVFIPSPYVFQGDITSGALALISAGYASKANTTARRYFDKLTLDLALGVRLAHINQQNTLHPKSPCRAV